MGVLTSPHAGGVAARRTLVAMLALAARGLARSIFGVRARWYPEAVGTALVVFVSLLDGLLLLLATSGHLERKDAALRQALRRNRALAAILRARAVGVPRSRTAEGILRFVNDAFARMHGFSVDELIGRPVAGAVQPRVSRRRRGQAAGTSTSMAHCASSPSTSARTARAFPC